jgi:hypothetical protein
MLDPSLVKRIEALEAVVKAFEDVIPTDTKTALHNNSNFMALFSFVQELAQHAGVSADNFLKHYEARRRYWYERHLEMTEDMYPAIAAELAQRTVEEVDTSEHYPSMFDPPPCDNTPH